MKQGNQIRNKCKPSNNTSGVTGVTWQKDKKRWRARIKGKNGTHHLGYYVSKEDAAKAYEIGKIIHGYHCEHGKDENLDYDEIMIEIEKKAVRKATDDHRPMTKEWFDAFENEKSQLIFKNKKFEKLKSSVDCSQH